MSRVELGLARRVGLHQLETEPDARERRAQLVRRVGEQHLVGVDQALDAGGGLIEALRQLRHLVAALDLDPGAQIAGAERLDAALQSLEPAGEPAHQRPGAERDRKRDHAEKRREDAPRSDAARTAARATSQRPSGSAIETAGPAAVRSQPPARLRLGGGSGRPAAASGSSLWPNSARSAPQPPRQPLDRLLLDFARRVRRRHQLDDDLAGDLERLLERRARRR